MEQANCVDCGKPLSDTILAAGLTRCTPCSAQRLQAATPQAAGRALEGPKMAYCPSCGREVDDDRSEFCAGCGHRLTDAGASRSIWSRFWGSWWVRAPLIVVALIFALGIVSALLSGSDSDSGSDFSLAFLEVQSTVNQAGFGVAEAHIAVSSCFTDEECIIAGDSLSQENTTYVPILETQITELENMEVPEDFVGFHAAYLEQLRLRVESGEQFIEGWETFNDALIERSFETFRESQAKLADLLDELEALEAR